MRLFILVTRWRRVCQHADTTQERLERSASGIGSAARRPAPSFEPSTVAPVTEMAYPVSVKGVFGPPGQVVLLHNERGEWELPGGRLDATDDDLEAALRREIDEELGLAVEVGAVVHAWRYEPIPGRVVLVVAYACRLVGEWPTSLRHSDEHDGVGVFASAELADLDLPDGYRDAIAVAASAPIRD